MPFAMLMYCAMHLPFEWSVFPMPLPLDAPVQGLVLQTLQESLLRVLRVAPAKSGKVAHPNPNPNPNPTLTLTLTLPNNT